MTMIECFVASMPFTNYDELFQRYMHECRFEEISNAAGLEMKSENTIIELSLKSLNFTPLVYTLNFSEPPMMRLVIRFSDYK